MQPLVKENDPHRIEVDRHGHFRMPADFLPEVAHLAACLDAFEDEDRIAVHMLQAFFEQPTVILLLIQGIEKHEIELRHLLQRFGQ